AGVGPEAHSAAHLLNPLLGPHQGDDRVLTLGLELTRIRVLELGHVPREFDDGGLQAKADAEERELVLTRPTDGFEHPFDAAHAEAPGYEKGVVSGEQLARDFLAGEPVGGDPFDFHPDVVGDPAMYQRLVNALVA